MKNTFKYILTLLFVLLFAISCNDSEEGLIQKAMYAEPQENFKIKSIVGRSSDNKYLYVSTEKGIYTLGADGEFTYVALNGEEANRVLYYSDKYILMQDETEEGNSIKYTLTTISSSAEDPFSSLENYYIVDKYSPDGITISYVFRKDDSYYTAYVDYSSITTTTGTSSFPTITVNSTELSTATIVGNNVFRVYNDENNYTYYKGNSILQYTVDGNTETAENISTCFYGLYKVSSSSIVGAASDRKMYYNNLTSAFTEKATKTPSHSIIPISQDGLLIYPNSAYYYKPSSSGVNSQSVSTNLSSVAPREIVKNKTDVNLYLVITAQNGGYILDTSTNKLTSLRDLSLTDFSKYVYELD